MLRVDILGLGGIQCLGCSNSVRKWIKTLVYTITPPNHLHIGHLPMHISIICSLEIHFVLKHVEYEKDDICRLGRCF